MKKPNCDCIQKIEGDTESVYITVSVGEYVTPYGYVDMKHTHHGEVFVKLNFCPQCGVEYKQE